MMKRREEKETPLFTEIEPLFTTQVYEHLKTWMPAHSEVVMGCAYDLSDLLILEKLVECKSVMLLLDGRPWLKKDSQYRRDRIAYYDKITQENGNQISIYDHPKNLPGKAFNSMHQKWLLGISKHGDCSIIYGSYNMSDNAKVNIESALCFPIVSPNLLFQFQQDFMHLVIQECTYSWKEFKVKYEIQ